MSFAKDLHQQQQQPHSEQRQQQQENVSYHRFRRILAQVHIILMKSICNFKYIRFQIAYVLFFVRLFCCTIQFLATTVKNMLLIQMGFNMAMPSIVIAALTGILNEHNLDETLKLTPLQASWLGMDDMMKMSRFLLM